MADHATKATVLLVSVGMDMKQAPPNQAAGAGRSLRAAAAKYIVAGNSPTLEGELGLYAERVDFYDEGVKTRDEIRAGIAKERQRWASRHYEFSSVVRTQYDPVKDIGSAIVRYSYDVSNGAKRRSGDAESLVVFGSVSNQPKVILVKEHKIK
jgi:hypothetical protein